MKLPRFAMVTACRLIAAASLATAAATASAAPCAGFTDVQDTDPYCTAVEWLKNRAITLGCSSTSVYCPTSPVSRASMALFMNRLGTALTPELRFVEDALGAVDPDASPVVCATSTVPAAAYPRQAIVSVAFAGLSAGTLGYAARAVASANGGATWVPLSAPANDVRESVAGAAWTNAATTAAHSIPAGQSAQYAVAVVRHSGTSDFTQARCHVTANVVNANGTSSPFDAH